MNDEKKKEEMPNKAFTPSKAEIASTGDRHLAMTSDRVKIKFRLNRADSTVKADANGVAIVDFATAERLVSDGYADYVKE
jgi:hypothetical protein